MHDKCRNEHGGFVDDQHPDLQPAEDEDVEEDIMNTSDNEEDLADHMREFHVSAYSPRYFTFRLWLPQFEGQDLQRYGKTSIFQYTPALPASHSRFPEIEDPTRCYVLLVEGVDQSKYNPDFEWSRHLPSTVELDRWEHDKYDVNIAPWVIDADTCS
jgi:hypothetical protein